MPKVVKLTEPLDIGGERIAQIALREPKFGDYLDIGMPVTYIVVKDGGFEQETPGVIRDWIERLYDGDPNVLLKLNLRDTLALRDAVVDFFREARTPPESPNPSAPSPDTSSSASASISGRSNP